MVDKNLINSLGISGQELDSQLQEALGTDFDPQKLGEIVDGCKAGTRLCGECKAQAKELMGDMLADLATKRKTAEERMGEYLRED